MNPPVLSLVQLHYLVATAEEASFAGAARRFNIKQSTLSRRIQALEEQLGVMLFERSTRGACPTEASKPFLEAARRIIAEVDALSRKAAAMRAGVGGTLRLGYCNILTAGPLKHLLSDALKDRSALSLSAQEASPENLIVALQTDRLDAAIVPLRRQISGLYSRVLWSERVMAAIPAMHPLAKRDQIYWHDIVSEHVILSSRGIGPCLKSMLAARQDSATDALVLDVSDTSPEATLALASMRQQISVTTEASLGHSWLDLKLVEIEDVGGAARIEFRMFWNPDNYKPALRHFLDFVASRYPG